MYRRKRPRPLLELSSRLRSRCLGALAARQLSVVVQAPCARSHPRACASRRPPELAQLASRVSLPPRRPGCAIARLARRRAAWRCRCGPGALWPAQCGAVRRGSACRVLLLAPQRSRRRVACSARTRAPPARGGVAARGCRPLAVAAAVGRVLQNVPSWQHRAEWRLPCFRAPPARLSSSDARSAPARRLLAAAWRRRARPRCCPRGRR